MSQTVPARPVCHGWGVAAERMGTMAITRRPGPDGDHTHDGTISRAGWYPVEAHERYWTGEAWSDHVRPLPSSPTVAVDHSPTARPNVIEEQRSFLWLGQTPEARRARLRGIGAVVLTLVLTHGLSLFFWAADRPLEAPEVLVVETRTGPVEVDARQHILDSCPASVAEVLEAPDDPYRWYDEVEYLLWEVEPRPGHSAMVMVNQDTGAVVCP
jgi:hypothetical protein